MRFRHPDGSTVHLAYCSNVHPAEDTDGVIGQLGRYAAPVRAALGASRLGVGLWLPAPAAAELAASPGEVKRLRSALDRCGLEVVTFNGFPYQGFHDPVVKHAVYQPDWSEPARLAYTLDLARVLVELLPDDVPDGSISTLPLAWTDRSGRPWPTEVWREALARAADGLAALAERTGKAVRLGLEPEPGCVLDLTAPACSILGGLLTEGPAASLAVAGSSYVNEWVGLCLDACHLAVAFDDPFEAIHGRGGVVAARLRVVKAQLSSAMRSYWPDRERHRLRRAVEGRFLHQVRRRVISGALEFAEDLDGALAGDLAGDGEWRVHFHVPVHHGPGTTQPELVAFLGQLVGGPVPVTRHLEVETYTWSVLPDPPTDDAGLVAGLAAELAWTRDQLTALGLEELP